jgi:phosphate-selective porin OprO/OprP
MQQIAGVGGLVLLLAPVFGVAEAAEPELILVKNVRLIDRHGRADDQTVSILIRDTNLYIVTRDEIEVTDKLAAFDARSGILMGDLDMGQPANFLIVDRDPREDIGVLLDTATHVVFAIRDGVVVKNTLPAVTLSAIEPGERKQTGWTAYSPPPMALPVTYRDRRKWNRWDTRYVSGIFIAAVALDRQRWLHQDDNSDQQVGDLKGYDGGEIRAMRVGVAGTLNFETPWVYTLIVVTHAFDKGFDTSTSDDFTLLDYRLDIPLPRQINLSVGKQKEPISMERLLLGTQMQMQERPATLDAMFTARNVGIALNGASFGQRIVWGGGWFNDWFDESQSFSESANQVIGRFTGLPWVSADNSHLIHLGLGIRYSDARETLRYRAAPEFNQAPVFVDTDNFDAGATLIWDLELSWRRGPYWIAAEFVRNEVKSSALGDPVIGGFHVGGSYIVTREMREYKRHNGTFGPIPVSRSVNQGGWGALEVAGRYSTIDLNDGGLNGGEMDIYSLGLNWWLTPKFGVNFNYRHIVLDRFGARGHSDGLMGRVVLMLE